MEGKAYPFRLPFFFFVKNFSKLENIEKINKQNV